VRVRSRRRNIVRASAIAGVSAFVFAVLGAAPAVAAGVSIVDFSYSPKTVTIQAGESVSWSNNGQSPHTVTADGGSFDSGNLNPGQGYAHTFSAPGTYPYHCQYHQAQGMVGTVIVLGGGGGSSTPTASGTLPNTGLGSGDLGLAVAGIALLLIGGAVLFGLRRRRA
jgi:LPXTG-motif cell wall-anchored protein